MDRPPTTPDALEAAPDAAGGVVLEADGLLLEVVPAGASVRRLVVTGPDGDRTNVVLGHADPTTYAVDGGYLGATIGRFGNRLSRGRFELDGTIREVVTNEGPNTLHGGLVGFDKHEWSVARVEPDLVELTLHSPDGDQGFPGAVDVTVTYSVAPGAVRIDYHATTDRATVVNLTNHAYFNLEGEGSGPVDDHVLAVEADAFTPTDAELIPTGEIRDVAGTAFDWRSPRPIGPGLLAADAQLAFGQGLDHNFVVRGAGLRRVATLRAPGGLTLTVASDQPGVQVYTGAHFDGTVVGTSGTAYGPRAGIALETQGFPDAPNHPGFPSTVLRAGEVLRSTTTWTFSFG
ncbi:galactose mutarotase [Intrasporangium mesophilum]